jgi:hypothetical protein
MIINKVVSGITYLLITFAIYAFASLAFTAMWNRSVTSMFDMPYITPREGVCFLGCVFLVGAFLPRFGK